MNESPHETALKLRTVSILRHPLPQPGLSFDKHLEILKAYSVFSKEGKEPLGYKDVGKTVSPFKVSGNNKFLESIGILSRVDQSGGKYLPTEAAIEIYKDLVWKRENDVKSKLAALIARSWFWEATSDLLSIKGKISEEELIQQLGREAGADPRIHTQSLRIIISYLKFSGLLNELDGVLTGPNAPSGGPLSSVQRHQSSIGVENLPSLGIGERTLIQTPLILGILITAESSEEQIRRVVRIVRDEINSQQALIPQRSARS